MTKPAAKVTQLQGWTVPATRVTMPSVQNTFNALRLEAFLHAAKIPSMKALESNLVMTGPPMLDWSAVVQQGLMPSKNFLSLSEFPFGNTELGESSIRQILFEGPLWSINVALQDAVKMI